MKSVILRNDGVGPAIVTTATFTKDGISLPRLVDHIDLPIPLWETYTGLSPGRVIPPQGEVIILRQSLGHLMDQGISEADGLDLLRALESQRSGIDLRIEYHDIYGNALEPYERTL